MKKNILFIVIVPAFFLALFYFASFDAQAAVANGQSCVQNSDCRSGFCSIVDELGSLKCTGGKEIGQPCSVALDCASGFCGEGNGYGLVCEARPSSPASPTTSTGGSTGTGGTSTTTTIRNSTCGPTEFCNPLGFSSVEGFLSHILSYLQKIIVVLALVFILVGAVLYITSAGVPGQIEKAKKAITASLIGLAIGIAAPSFLKEISIILGWSEVNNAQVTGALTLTQIALNVVKFLLSTIGILALVMMLVGATFYVSAAGDEEQTKKGKAIFKYAVFGIIMAMVSMVVIKQVALLLAK